MGLGFIIVAYVLCSVGIYYVLHVGLFIIVHVRSHYCFHLFLSYDFYSMEFVRLTNDILKDFLLLTH